MLSVDYGEVDFTGLRIAVHSVPMFHGMGTTQVGWVVGVVMMAFLCAVITHNVLVLCREQLVPR